MLASRQNKFSHIAERIEEEYEAESSLYEEQYDDDRGFNEDFDSPVTNRRYPKGITDCEPLQKEEKRPVYSGRLGPKLKVQRPKSSESVKTNMSLLTCSSMGTTHSKKKIRWKKVDDEELKPEPDGEIGFSPELTVRSESRESTSTTNWEMMAKRKSGILEKMMMKDRDTAQTVGGMKAMNRLFQAKTTLEALNDLERRLLMQSADTTGLNLRGNIKSMSMTDISRITPAALKYSRSNSASGKPIVPKPRITPNRSMFREYDRVQNSLSSGNKLPFLGHGGASATTAHSGGSFHQHITVNLRNRINSTMNSLSRMTGIGDKPETPISNYENRLKQNDTYVHIEKDFEKRAKMPHRVRVCPQLAKTIRKEIRERVGKPKPKVIKKDDLETWTLANRVDPVCHRNLMVYTWLQNLEEKQFVKDVHGLEKKQVII